MSNTTYNGHPSREHWNISLWILNDEGLYRLAQECREQATSNAQAAESFLIHIHDCGITHTPDGVRYSTERVAYVMADLD